MDIEALSLDFRKHAQELRDSWQARVLDRTKNGAFGLVVLSVLAHNFDEAMETLLRVVFPGFRSITAPFLCTTGKVDKTGAIVADMVTADGRIAKDTVVFDSLQHFQTGFRVLADELKLTDKERLELFSAAKRWVVADRRLDPTMNPADPDARRLVH